MAWVHNRTLDFTGPTKFNIYFGADFQLGSDSTDKSVIRRWVNEVMEDPLGLWCILGDIEDDDRPSTRAIRRGAFAERREVQTADAKKHILYIEKEVIPLLAPLTESKLGSLGVLAGHHWYDLGELNSTQYICNRLSTMGRKQKVPYLGQMSAWVHLKFQKGDPSSRGPLQRKIHIQHGVGGGKTIAAALTALERTSKGFRADAYIRAHDCTLVAGKYDQVESKDSDTPGLNHRTVTLMNVGAATRGYEMTLDNPSYPEMGMMNPRTLGWGKLECYVHKELKAVDPSKNWDVRFRATI